MPALIKLEGGKAAFAEDRFVHVAQDEAIPASGDVILTLTRFQSDGVSILAQGRKVGVRLESEQAIEDLVLSLPQMSVVALSFPKFRDGRHFSSARLLRERFGYEGELRAVGEVLRELASFMIRCGFDAFVLRADKDPHKALSAYDDFCESYQSAVNQPVPLFRRRQAVLATLDRAGTS